MNNGFGASPELDGIGAGVIVTLIVIPVVRKSLFCQ